MLLAIVHADICPKIIQGSYGIKPREESGLAHLTIPSSVLQMVNNLACGSEGLFCTLQPQGFSNLRTLEAKKTQKAMGGELASSQWATHSKGHPEGKEGIPIAACFSYPHHFVSRVLSHTQCSAWSKRLTDTHMWTWISLCTIHSIL